MPKQSVMGVKLKKAPMPFRLFRERYIRNRLRDLKGGHLNQYLLENIRRFKIFAVVLEDGRESLYREDGSFNGKLLCSWDEKYLKQLYNTYKDTFNEGLDKD